MPRPLHNEPTELTELGSIAAARLSASGACSPSLANVSRRCGIDKAALSRLENGQDPNPTLDTLWRYAAGLSQRVLLNAADIAAATGANMVSRTKGKHVGKR